MVKSGKKTTGVQVKDHLTGKTYEVKSKAVINATGVFTDAVMNLDNPRHKQMIAPSQGIHLVVDKEFLPGETAIMIPRTDDGRVLFAVPWHNKIVLGTTDTPIKTKNAASFLEPVPQEAEIDFILKHIGRYLSKDPQRSDIRSMFAGLRPLVKASGRRTAALSRDHLVSVSDSGLITITGGKWTTYRRMAEDVINIAIEKNKLPVRPCMTKDLLLSGNNQPLMPPEIFSLSTEQVKSAIKRSVGMEMCMTVEDFLSRRTRSLLLDAKAAIQQSPVVASLMAAERKKNDHWIKEQIDSFKLVANNYLPILNLN
jgi:glycerol-3-phosphate dehydrogenase